MESTFLRFPSFGMHAASFVGPQATSRAVPLAPAAPAGHVEPFPSTRYASRRPRCGDLDAILAQEPLPKGSLANLEYHALLGTLTYEMVELAELLAPLTPEESVRYMDVVDRLDGYAPESASIPGYALDAEGLPMNNRTAGRLNRLTGKNFDVRQWCKVIEEEGEVEPRFHQSDNGRPRTVRRVSDPVSHSRREACRANIASRAAEAKRRRSHKGDLHPVMIKKRVHSPG